MYLDQIKSELLEAQDVLAKFIADENNIKLIQQAALLISDSFKNGGKVLSCGNGGSHCDAMHFAEELTGRYRENRPAYPAIAISDVSHVSCVSNDFGYDYVFSRYIEGVGKAGDVLFGLSTSGNSKRERYESDCHDRQRRWANGGISRCGNSRTAFQIRRSHSGNPH